MDRPALCDLAPASHEIIAHVKMSMTGNGCTRRLNHRSKGCLLFDCLECRLEINEHVLYRIWRLSNSHSSIGRGRTNGDDKPNSSTFKSLKNLLQLDRKMSCLPTTSKGRRKNMNRTNRWDWLRLRACTALWKSLRNEPLSF